MASAVKPSRIGFRGGEAPLLAIPESRRRITAQAADPSRFRRT
jgi:hypothetical protein